ncbi:MAG: DUF1501 domain-containing protein [Planctomycetota bacterium]
MDLTRRAFLGRTGLSLAAVPGLGLLPGLDSLCVLPAAGTRCLVMLELAGGNDGLNTVIPFEDPAYHAARPVLRVREGQHALEDGVALHPRLGRLAELYKEGSLAVVEGVGYPSPNRSHFRSMDIWQSARPDQERPRKGWLGLAAAALAAAGARRPAMALGQAERPLCLEARRIVVPAIDSLADYELWSGGGEDGRGRLAEVRDLATARGEGDDAVARLLKATAREAAESAARIREATRSYRPAVEFPRTRTGRDLELAAKVLSASIGTRILHLRQGGYDTHAGQDRTHGNLLGEVGDALAALARDLRARKLWDDCLVLVFTEFGRRVAENRSRGTDHGAAGPVLALGGRVRGGLHGRRPALDDLDGEGDLRFTTDFRGIYACVLERWLGVEPTRILGGRFDGPDLLAAT